MSISHLLRWDPERHPCQYSDEVIDVLRDLIPPGAHVHDPMAGPGVRLGKLCDELVCVFTGGDIDGPWVDQDLRVVIGADARDHASYPAGKFITCLSPTYENVRCADYKDGPTPRTKRKGRRDYALALGHPLHPGNLARFTGHQSARKTALYWQGHRDAVKHWSDRVLLNVDLPISEPWQQLLRDHGYTIEQVIPVYTRRYGGLDNAEKRAEHEVVIVASRQNDSRRF